VGDKEKIIFPQETVEILFPFYFVINNNFKIIKAGKSLLKLHKNIINSNFENEFCFKRPFSVELSFESISEFINQIFILSSLKQPNLLMRGQMIINNQQLIFIGSPWLTSTEDLEKFNLNIVDFALHDGVTDMLQVLNTKEIITKDIIKLNEDLQSQKKELKHSELELKNSNNRLSVLIKSIKSAILLENEERKIVLANEAFCKLFEIPVSPDLLIGADCSNAAEESKMFFKDSELFVKRINQILIEKKHIQNEELELANGIFLERDFIPIFSGNEYHGHLWIYKDISDRKKNEFELIKAKEKAISTKKAKEQFMANMSHELRTPLNIITGIVSLIEEENLSSSQQEYLNIIKTSSENLLSLVNDILDFEKIEAKKIVFHLEPINIKSLVYDCIDSLKFQAKTKKIKITQTIDLDFPQYILADPLRLKQILINLLSNSIKFTERGSIVVSVKHQAIQNNHIELELQVKDSGIGIPKKEIKTIFNRYSQVHNLKNKTYGGTGLGLTIVKSLVESQNGKITVESTINKGTIFTIKIPLQICTECKKDNLKFKKDLRDLNSKKILIVEDNSLNQMIISKMLSKNKAIVDVAENGKIALEKISHKHYDLILMDLQMPIMDGIETTLEIRKLNDKLKSQIPIIALTANILNEEKEKCYKIGMNGYLTKPITEEAILNHIHEILSSKKTYINLEYLKSIDPDDASFSEKIINEFLKSSPEILKELKKATKEKNYPGIQKLTHKLKGMFGYIGADEFKNIITSIEHNAIETKNIELIRKQFIEIEEGFPNLIKELENEIR
jgi:signal transduction histidine kinase/CheY-like chemotaxis protein